MNKNQVTEDFFFNFGLVNTFGDRMQKNTLKSLKDENSNLGGNSKILCYQIKKLWGLQLQGIKTNSMTRKKFVSLKTIDEINLY